MSNLNDRRSIWQWMFAAQGEQDMAAVASTLKQYASADLVLAKVMDGQSFQAAYDYGANAFHNLAEWQAAQAQAATAGIEAVPWVLAQHHDDAAAHAALGETLAVDLEPYRQFWADGPADIPTYIAGLRAGGVKNLWIAVDPRPARLADLGIADWGSSVDALWAQTYWTDFNEPALQSVSYISGLQQYGVPVVPMLPYNGTAGDMTAFWTACKQLGCRSTSLWRLGSANAAQLRAFGALDVSAPPQPCDELAQELEAAKGEITTLTATVNHLQSILDVVKAAVV